MLLTQANRFNTLNSFVRDISKLSSVAYDDYLAFISYYITNETQQQSQEELFVFYEEFLRQCKIDPIFEQKVRNREVMKDIYYTISHQGSVDINHQLSELVSNAIDACGKPEDSVGRFGQGGMQIWQLIMDRNASVVYTTKKKDHEPFWVMLYMNNEKRHVATGTNKKELPARDSTQKEESEKNRERIGTTCQINFPKDNNLSENEKESFIHAIIEKYAYSTVPVLIRYTDDGKKKTTKVGCRKHSNSKKVIIDITTHAIMIWDQGLGMNAQTVASSLLYPQLSEGKSHPQGDPNTTQLVEYPFVYEKTGKSQCDLVVGNTVIDSLFFQSETGTERKAIRFPAGISLTESKASIALTPLVYTCFSSLLQSCADEQNIVTKQQTFEFLIQSLAKLALKQPNQVINHTMFQNEEGENLIVAIIKQLRIAGINVFPDNPNVIDSLPQEVKDTTITLPCVCIGVWNRQVIQSIPGVTNLENTHSIENTSVPFFSYPFDSVSEAGQRGYLHIEDNGKVVAVAIDSAVDLHNPETRTILNTAINLNVGYEQPGDKVWYGRIGSERFTKIQTYENGVVYKNIGEEAKNVREDQENFESIEYSLSTKSLDEVYENSDFGAGFYISQQQIDQTTDNIILTAELSDGIEKRKEYLLTLSREKTLSDDQIYFLVWSGIDSIENIDEHIMHQYLESINDISTTDTQKLALISASTIISDQGNLNTVIPHIIAVIKQASDKVCDMIIHLPRSPQTITLAQMMLLKDDINKEQEYLNMAFSYPRLFAIIETGGLCSFEKYGMSLRKSDFEYYIIMKEDNQLTKKIFYIKEGAQKKNLLSVLKKESKYSCYIHDLKTDRGQKIENCLGETFEFVYRPDVLGNGLLGIGVNKKGVSHRSYIIYNLKSKKGQTLKDESGNEIFHYSSLKEITMLSESLVGFAVKKGEGMYSYITYDLTTGIGKLLPDYRGNNTFDRIGDTKTMADGYWFIDIEKDGILSYILSNDLRTELSKYIKNDLGYTEFVIKVSERIWHNLRGFKISLPEKDKESYTYIVYDASNNEFRYFQDNSGKTFMDMIISPFCIGEELLVFQYFVLNVGGLHVVYNVKENTSYKISDEKYDELELLYKRKIKSNRMKDKNNSEDIHSDFSPYLPLFLCDPDSQFLDSKSHVLLDKDSTTHSFSLSSLLYQNQESTPTKDTASKSQNLVEKFKHGFLKLLGLYGDVSTASALTTNLSLEQKLQNYSNLSSDSSKNFSLFHNRIRTTTGSQGDIWLRERSQNSLDAIKKSKITNKPICREFFLNEGGNLVAQITDSVGMSPQAVYEHLLTIGDSTKRQEKDIHQEDSQIGMFGVGFFSAFTDTCKQVRIQTTKDKTTTTLVMTPKRMSKTSENLGRDDIDIVTTIAYLDLADGTIMQRIDTSSGLSASVDAISMSETLKTYISAATANPITLQIADKVEKINTAKKVYERHGYTMYSGHQSGWSQNGLYIGVSSYLIETFPSWMQDIIKKEKLIIDIPSRYSLTRDRSQLSSPHDHKKIITDSFGHLARYCIQLVCDGKYNIPQIPQDFFSFDFNYRTKFANSTVVAKAKHIAQNVNDSKEISQEDIAYISNKKVIHSKEVEDQIHMMYFLCYIRGFVELDGKGISLMDMQKNKNNSTFLQKRKPYLQGRFASWLEFDTARSEQSLENSTGRTETVNPIDFLYKEGIDKPRIQKVLNIITSKVEQLNKKHSNNQIKNIVFSVPESTKHTAIASYSKYNNTLNRNIKQFLPGGYFDDIRDLEDPLFSEKLINVITHEYAHHIEGVDDSLVVTHNKGNGQTFEFFQRNALAILYNEAKKNGR